MKKFIIGCDGEQAKIVEADDHMDALIKFFEYKNWKSEVLSRSVKAQQSLNDALDVMYLFNEYSWTINIFAEIHDDDIMVCSIANILN